jgi:hypothetical protein
MAGKKTIQNNGRTADGRFKKGHTNGFKPGQSGNPGGRPRNDTLTASLLAKLKELAPGADEKTVADCLATVLVREALQGSIHAISLIADRTEGKARQAIDVDVKTMWNITELMSGDLTEAIHESGLSQDQADKLLEAVEQRWRTIRVDGSRGDPEG